MKIHVVHAQWSAEGEVYPGGYHDVELTPEFAPLLAAAEASGSVVVLEETEEERELLHPHVESDEDSLAKLEAAVESGEWAVGNHEFFLAEARQKLELHNDPEDELELSENEVAWLEKGIEDSTAALAELAAGGDE